MNHQQIRIFLLTLIFSISVEHSKAQSQTSANDSIEIRPGQITFIYPLGTNGTASGETSNNFSLNILWGVNGGVKGAELGGLVNQSYGSVTGAQFAGWGNLNTQKVVGGQFAGLFNIVFSSFQGIQAAGLLNINSQEVSNSDSLPFPGSGSTGVQLGGILNINTNSMTGMQAAGMVNLQTDTINGAQIAGLLNSSDCVRGVQLSGIFNKTKMLSGVQVGLINFADTVHKGVQIGLINIAKNGYKAAEIEYNESFYINISYKMGTERFYSIFSLSFTERDDAKFWAPGFGFGTYYSLGQKVGLNIDALSYIVNEDEWWTNDLNALYKLKVTGSYQIAQNLALYGGVSVNTMISGIEDGDGNPKGSLFKTPNAFYDKIHNDNHILIYPGLHAGIRF